MAWPTTPIIADQVGQVFDTLITRSFGPDAVPSGTEQYDEGYATGFADGGGGGGGVPTEGQIWPRRG